jgi:hypothetical protein
MIPVKMQKTQIEAAGFEWMPIARGIYRHNFPVWSQRSMRGRVPIDHHLVAIDWSLFGLPLLSILLIYSIFYGRQSRGGRDALSHFPSFSDCLDFVPEYRIFSGLMAVQFVVLALTLFVRDQTINLTRIAKDKDRLRRYQTVRIAMNVSAGVFVVGWLLMSIVPPKSSAALNAAGVYMFSFFSIIYFLTSDFLIGLVWKSVRFASRVFTLVAGLLSLLGLVLRQWVSGNSAKTWSVGATCQALGLIATGLKLALAARDLPGHAIRMSGK